VEQNEIVAKVSVLEEKSKAHSKRIENLEDKTEHLNKLTYIVERQEVQFEKFTNTLQEISESLKESSTAYKNLDNRVGQLEDSKKSNLNRWIDFGWKLAAGLVLAWLLFEFSIGGKK
jgi:Mn-containing catalase